MADHYEVIKQAPGFGNRLGDSIKGIFIGVLLFFAAFPVLWWGENRQNLAELVQKAELVGSESTAITDGKFIKTTGMLHSAQSPIDSQFLMHTGSTRALKLSRHVEMYAWKENKKTEKVGNNQEKVTYDYEKAWTSLPADSSQFYDATGHFNPVMGEKDVSFSVQNLAIGNLPIDAAKVEYWDLRTLPVSQDMLVNSPLRIFKANGGQIYVPLDNSPVREVGTNPLIGDLKVSYTYFPNDVAGSVVGAWSAGQIAPYVYDDTDTFLGAYAGGLKEFQAFLQSRHNMITWVIRGLCLVFMWLGLNMMLGPILTLLDSIPLVGGAGKALISAVTGAIAFVLWALTIFVAKLWLVLLIVAVIGVGVAVGLKMKKSETVNAAKAA